MQVIEITRIIGDSAQVVLGDDGYFLGNVPIAGVLRLPMLIRSEAEYDKAAAIMAPFIERAFARKGVLVLGTYLYPPQVIFSRKPLTRRDRKSGSPRRSRANSSISSAASQSPWAHPTCLRRSIAASWTGH